MKKTLHLQKVKRQFSSKGLETGEGYMYFIVIVYNSYNMYVYCESNFPLHETIPKLTRLINKTSKRRMII